MDARKAIGQRLLKIRTEKDETQEQVADSVGISYVSLSRYETGQRMPKMNILAKLADHYGVTTDELLGRATADELEPQAPKTPEARIVSAGMDRKPQGARETLLSVILAMYQKDHPEYFHQEGSAPHDA